jgi:hypothetical protein
MRMDSGPVSQNYTTIVRPTGSMPDPAPNEAEKRRATNHHCDTPAAGSESEGVRRLRFETQRTQRTRRNAEASETVPVRRRCGHAVLGAGVCRVGQSEPPPCGFTVRSRDEPGKRSSPTGSAGPPGCGHHHHPRRIDPVHSTITVRQKHASSTSRRLARCDRLEVEAAIRWAAATTLVIPA